MRSSTRSTATYNPGYKILADSRVVSIGYFRTMQIPAPGGRSVQAGSNCKDIVVNRSFANRYFGEARRSDIDCRRYRTRFRERFAGWWATRESRV